jgi:DNA-binding GntR family transcriptional regulator
MNAGLYTTPDPGPGPGSAARTGAGTGLPPAGARRPRTLRREQVYRELRTRILAGEFPPRVRLAEERLGALLEVSRTPIREALVRLHADGLVRHDPENGGYHVAPPDLMRLRDLYELRIALELHGLTRAAQEEEITHDPAVMEPLRDRWRALQGDLPAPDASFVEVDESFHVTLSRAAGNLAVTETLETVNARIRPVRMYDFLTADRIAETVDQHLEIAESVLAGDITEAVQQMRRHVGVSLEVVEKRAARAITQMLVYGGTRAGEPT